jgi:hypothetical protein
MSTTSIIGTGRFRIRRPIPLVGACLAGLLVLLANGTAHATSVKSGTTVTGLTADIAGVGSSGGVVFLQVAAGQSGEPCTATSWAVILIGANYPSSSQQQSIALAALLSGRKVNVTLSGCSIAWTGASTTYPVVTSIEIH